MNRRSFLAWFTSLLSTFLGACMSWYPAHHDEDVIGGVTVGATGATATTGPTGTTGSALGATGGTGASGAPADHWQSYKYLSNGGGGAYSNSAVGFFQKTTSQYDDISGASRVQNQTDSADRFRCHQTGIYRLQFSINIARDSASADRSSMLRLTWGDYESGTPVDDPLMQWYGGAPDVDGQEQIDGIWVGTLTAGREYSLYTTDGEGEAAAPIETRLDQCNNFFLEWVRDS